MEAIPNFDFSIPDWIQATLRCGVRCPNTEQLAVVDGIARLLVDLGLQAHFHDLVVKYHTAEILSCVFHSPLLSVSLYHASFACAFPRITPAQPITLRTL